MIIILQAVHHVIIHVQLALDRAASLQTVQVAIIQEVILILGQVYAPYAMDFVLHAQLYYKLHVHLVNMAPF